MTDNEDFTETISEAEKQLEEFKKQHKSLKKKLKKSKQNITNRNSEKKS